MSLVIASPAPGTPTRTGQRPPVPHYEPGGDQSQGQCEERQEVGTGPHKRRGGRLRCRRWRGRGRGGGRLRRGRRRRRRCRRRSDQLHYGVVVVGDLVALVVLTLGGDY